MKWSRLQGARLKRRERGMQFTGLVNDYLHARPACENFIDNTADQTARFGLVASNPLTFILQTMFPRLLDTFCYEISFLLTQTGGCRYVRILDGHSIRKNVNKDNAEIVPIDIYCFPFFRSEQQRFKYCGIQAEPIMQTS